MTTAAEPTRIDWIAAVPALDGERRVQGLERPVSIRRDVHGVAHIRAETEHDAWFGQGYACAQDRMWQMEHDRRRAVGRWAEAAGPSALPADRLARRLDFERSARADLAALSAATHAMIEAYAAGVNAFLTGGDPLPPEYALTGITPEPWQPWHTLVSFKIRHLHQGPWQRKLMQGGLLARVGPETFTRLDPRAAPGTAIILPSGDGIGELLALAESDVAAAAEELHFLADADSGSNSWVVSGAGTTTGKPVACNDSHRAIDVPNVYWQAHLACPAFNVIGAAIPGVPGFSHFGYNGNVVWNITNVGADFQDLYVEQFDPEQPGRYRTADGWAMAERTESEIRVRGGAVETVESWRTHHGPIVHGDPRRGPALALRYTATDGPNPTFECMRPMLTARIVDDLFDAQRNWVDPVHNLLAADTNGTIGYLLRGALPVRAGVAHRVVPVPGWTGDGEWLGTVPFERMPRLIDPPDGFFVTANNRVIPGDDPYVAHDFAVPARAMRARELLTSATPQTPATIMDFQRDTVSIPARLWAALLARVGPFDGDAERARALLAGWDGELRPESAPALLYAFLRPAITRALFEPVVGEEVWAWLVSGRAPQAETVIGRWLGRIVFQLEGTYRDHAPDGRPWGDVLGYPLVTAWGKAVEKAGADPSAWRWGEHHGTRPRHPLAGVFPQVASVLNPPRVMVGGDADTLCVSGYGLSDRGGFDLTNAPVYRQTVDIAGSVPDGWVQPGGVSGLPGTSYYADQLPAWAQGGRVEMLRDEAQLATAIRHTLILHSARGDSLKPEQVSEQAGR